MADLTALLLATQTSDPATRQAAEAQIKAAEQASAEQYFTLLAQELANNEKDRVARQLSGLLLKNGLTAKDPTRDRELKARWAGLPAPARNLVKEAVTVALVTPDKDIGKAAGQVLAKIGVIEIPANEWPTLVPMLLDHVTKTDARVKEIALITLGYLCEELVAITENNNAVVPEEHSNKILTAVVEGMRGAEMAVKLEATRAFYHACILAQKNFKNEQERNFIMTVVNETCRTQGPEAAPVQIAAFECLVQIATEYYDYLVPYMNVLGPLTWETIKNSPENVAIPAMEFWSTICDEEQYLQDEVASGNPSSERRSLNLIKQALQFLIPLLTETLTRRQSEDDDDTWNLAMAAGTCLGLVAQVVGDDCVDQVLAFVSSNFQNQDWKFRDAAILAYGSIMEGPSSEKMRPMVNQSFPVMVQALRDPSVAVRDTIAWTLGRIAQFHPAIVPVKELTPLLGEKLSDVPRVAANICWVIEVMAEEQSPGFNADTTALSEFFAPLAQALLQVTARPDGDEKQLRMAGYNTLSVLVSRAGNDCLPAMENLAEEMLNQLSQSFGRLENCCELQGLICGVLGALILRLQTRVNAVVADKVMEECLKVFAAYQQVKGGSPCLQEEALLVVTALVNSVGLGFDKYMQFFAPYLMIGLNNIEDEAVLRMSTGFIGDLCRALDAKMVVYCAPLLDVLYKNLQNPSVERKIKASIMTCFGDMAIAIGGEFEKYMPPVVKMLQEAAGTKLENGPANDEEWVDYLNKLREGVLDGYSGIIHGLKASGKLHLFKEHVNHVLYFVREIAEEESRGTVQESVMKAAVGLVGDIVQAFQQEIMVHLNDAPFLLKLVQYAQACTDPSIRQTSQWLQQLVTKYRAGGQ